MCKNNYMNLVRILLILFSLTSSTNPIPAPTRILVGAPPTPVVSGEIWLVADRWGAYPGVLVATITNGDLQKTQGIHFPPYWEQAFDYHVLVAVSDRPAASAPPAPYEDFAYGPVGHPEYLSRFTNIYLSPPLSARQLGKDWDEALRALGHSAGDSLMLPPPARRTIQLEYPDGTPLADAQVPVLMFASNENHCGEPVGIDLGIFKTDAEGRISLMATDSSLALLKGFLKQQVGGPAGTVFTFVPDVIVGVDQDITIKHLWELPQYDYAVWLRNSDNQPIARAHVVACDNSDACGAGCGPLFGAPKSDEMGVLRFREGDLREMRSLTLVNAVGQKRDLTNAEMKKLFTTHQLHLVW